MKKSLIIMMSKYDSLFLLTLCLTVVTADIVDVERAKRDIPEECKGHGHPPGEHLTKICCPLPDISGIDEAIESCHGIMHQNPPAAAGSAVAMQKHRANRVANNPNQGPPPRGAAFIEKRNCFMECVFNKTGIMTPEGQINEDALNKKLENEANSKWTSIVPSIHNKCLTLAKESNMNANQGCKSGPAEYFKCFGRESFLNCPADLWNNSAECNDVRAKLEQCPNLPPPPPPRPNVPLPRP